MFTTHHSSLFSRLLVLLAAMLLCAGWTAAQEVAEAEYPYKRDIKKGRFEKAESRIQRRLSRDPDNLECHYAAFVLYSSPAFDSHNVDRAYQHLVTVRTLFGSADAKQIDRWMRDSFSGALIDHDLRNICSSAMRQAWQLGTIDAFQHFLDLYQLATPSQVDSMTYSRDSLQLVQVRHADNFDLVEAYIASHASSRLLPEAVALRDSMAFARADALHSTAAYEQYRTAYPASAFAQRATDSVYLLEYRHARHLDAEQYYRTYCDRYPHSPFRSQCMLLADSLEYHRVVDTTRWQSIAAYIEGVPPMAYQGEPPLNRRWHMRAVRRLASIGLRDGTLAALDPALPHLHPSDSLYSAIAATLHHAYIHASVLNYHRFYSRYPHLMPDSVRQHDSLALALYHNYHYHIIDSCIRAIAPCHEAFLMLQQLLKDHIDHHRWADAQTTAHRYADCFGNDYDYQCLLTTLRTPQSASANPSLLGPSINTPKGNEYAPVLSADGNTLYFAGQHRTDNIGGEDVYLSRRNGRKWGAATLDMDLSHTYGNEAPLSVSTDGNTLLLFRSGALFAAHRTAQGWTVKPVETKTPQGKPLSPSAGAKTDATLAANGRLLLWAERGTTSRHADSSMNIYAAILDTDGSWGQPFELGPAINTPFDERSPLLHPDMHTLYFCSESHGSLGQMDLFVSHRLCDTGWTQWSTPVNVGRTFNSTADEWGFKITTDGKQAYYAKSTRSMDIYTATLPPAARPQPVTALVGTVRDRAGHPVATRLQWENLTTGQPLGQCYTNPATGRYYFLVPQGEEYGFYVDDSNFFPASAHADLSGRNLPDSIVTNLTVSSYDQLTNEGRTQVLHNIFFDASSHHIDPRSDCELRRMARLVTQLGYTLEITSHYDAPPTAPATQKPGGNAEPLTEQRAQELRQYLIGLGCNPKDVTAHGATNKPSGNRAGNRRSTGRSTEVRLSRP